MLDFVTIKTSSQKKGTVEIYPEFLVKRSKDLMIRGHSFYAVWDEEAGLWSRSEDDIQRMVDKMTREFADKMAGSEDHTVLKLMANFSSKKWTEWQQYCKSLPDNYRELDEVLVFQNEEVKKTDYVSRKLPYPLEKDGNCPAYNELMDVLYEPSERKKLEWAIGSVIAGDSKKIQKFIVLYGGPGSGKSTVLNIIQDLFPEYWSVFESKALGSANNAFALEAFRSNPLIGIEHDGDLSRIEDNTKLNSIISHETMVVNEKHKSIYESRFNSFLFMGTNKPVRITDAKSGIIRRLIDVSPTGNKIPYRKYQELLHQIQFELGAIAGHCLKVYESMGESYYDTYVPVSMMSSTNDFYNFVEDNYDFFMIDHPEGVTLNAAWIRYKEYCTDANIPYPYTKRLFKEELKNYFSDFKDRHNRDKNVYIGFLKEKLEYRMEEENDEYNSMIEKDTESVGEDSWLKFDCTESLFDKEFADCHAQYAAESGNPQARWTGMKTRLNELDTTKLHWVKVPTKLIVIDFDLKDENGNKDFEANLKAASKWPATYAELSKSGAGIHLHYFYDGDVKQLSRVFDEDIEIKVFTGNSALRRLVTLCNNIMIASISSGLPLKGVKPTVLQDVTIKSERDLRNRIQRNLRKEVHASTKPSIDFIYKLLEEAYEQGLKYDVRDMRPDIQQFALSSTHQADYCLRLVGKMHFCSDEPTENIENYEDNRPIVFYDVEVFPNLFVVCWKKQGKGAKVIRMINPSGAEIEELIKFKLVGFNNRKYDNHMLYARMMGYTEEQLFRLSQKIIEEQDKNAFFGEAYNLSYTDIYDFLSAGNKMGLKKWEIKLHIHHHENELPWDQPVPKERWNEVADYCADDVIATEAVWDANQGDWIAREILALMSGLTVNDTTNSHTKKIIVGNDPNPQSQFIYTDLSTIFPGYEYSPYGIDKSRYNEGTKIVRGKSIYMGEDPGEGGYAWAQPGMYTNVALLDIASMHPHSAIRLNIFGDKYTKRFKGLVEVRVYVKHENYEAAKQMLTEILETLDNMGKLDEYLSDPSKAKALADALKTAINSVYGLTSATFPNALRDPRNKDNIVAKYGALFMINLKHEVQKLGYTVVHIKTDSIKIADADEKIINFVSKYGEEYGYTFEHEATYSKMCIVNDAVYIARYNKPKIDKETGKEIWWTATGTQFQIPYVFKTLFSHEPIEFWDLCETKSVSTAMYLDMNERLGPDEHDYRFIGKIGLFCPVKPGAGGGVLLRKTGDNKFAAATGTKKPYKVAAGEPDVYYWMESEMVQTLGIEDQIDLGYYRYLVDEAIEAISQYGNFEWFASDEVAPNMSWMNIPETDTEEVPFEDWDAMNKPVAA